MKIFSLVLMLMTILASQALFAHSDHQHTPISESAAQELALDVAGNLSSSDVGLGFGQLSKTWASVPANNVATSKKGNGYYILSVFNESEKKTLYILMSSSGEVYDANFTGVFEGIE